MRIAQFTGPVASGVLRLRKSKYQKQFLEAFCQQEGRGHLSRTIGAINSNSLGVYKSPLLLNTSSDTYLPSNHHCGLPTQSERDHHIWCDQNKHVKSLASTIFMTPVLLKQLDWWIPYHTISPILGPPFRETKPHVIHIHFNSGFLMDLNSWNPLAPKPHCFVFFGSSWWSRNLVFVACVLCWPKGNLGCWMPEIWYRCIPGLVSIR